MLRIIIVDDEALYRQYIISSIDWKEYGFEICCEARNGIEALEMIEAHKPDIALVDINMPYMDGLALAENLKEKYSHISIVLITGYGEFEYARKAIKLGVMDYVLKPFNQEELMAPLMKIKESCEKNRLKEASGREDIYLIKERLLNILIGNEFTLSDEDMKAQLNRFDIIMHSSIFQVAVVEIENLYQKWSEASEIVLWQGAVANILNDIISIKGQNIVFKGPEGRIISLLEFGDEDDLREFKAGQYQRLCEVVKKYFDFTVMVGIGSHARGFKDVRRSYQEALVALQNRIMAGSLKVIEYTGLEADGMKTGFYPSEINENLLLGLKMNDLEKIKIELNHIFTYIQENRLSADYTCTILAGLVSLCLSYVTELDQNIEDVFGKGFSPYLEIKNMTSIELSYGWVLGLFQKAIHFSSENKFTRSGRLVEKAKEYIDANIQDSGLELEMISKNVFASPDHLRKVFRKKTGVTITEYITNARMQKAKELLASGRYISIFAISELVGYSDVSYFSKCFKKYTGLAPSEYENLKNTP